MKRQWKVAAVGLMMFAQSCADGMGEIGLMESRSASADAAPMTISKEEREREHPVFAGTYSITVASQESGKVVCDGTFDGVLWSDQLFNPDGVMNCPLGQSMKLSETFPRNTSHGKEEYKDFGLVVRRDAQEGFRMEPNPAYGLALVQSHEEFVGYSVADEVTLTYVKDGNEVQSKGMYGFSVESTDGNMAIESGEEFERVLSYKVVTSGFEGVPKKEVGLEPSRQTWINTKPIGLLKIQIHSTLKDQMPGLTGSIGHLLYGPITITIQLKKSRPLVDSDNDRR